MFIVVHSVLCLYYIGNLCNCVLLHTLRTSANVILCACVRSNFKKINVHFQKPYIHKILEVFIILSYKLICLIISIIITSVFAVRYYYCYFFYGLAVRLHECAMLLKLFPTEVLSPMNDKVKLLVNDYLNYD